MTWPIRRKAPLRVGAKAKSKHTVGPDCWCRPITVIDQNTGLKHLQHRQGASKYGNVKKKGSDGRTYHSGLEKSLNELLMLRERAGEIKILKRQYRHHFRINGVKIGEFWPDFQVQDVKTGEVYFIEAKGFEKDIWAWKKNLWEATATHRLEIWKGTAERPMLHETIIPVNLDTGNHNDKKENE